MYRYIQVKRDADWGGNDGAPSLVDLWPVVSMCHHRLKAFEKPYKQKIHTGIAGGADNAASLNRLDLPKEEEAARDEKTGAAVNIYDEKGS